jgi:hypothetical protein
MGRFTSVQAYTDNNSSIRKVTYEQAAAQGASGGGGGDGSTNAAGGGIRANVRPEKVVNPYGSTAGAGSGEFHLYRHGRNREMARLRNMDVAARVTAANAAFTAERAADAAWSEARTASKRKKRERAKEAKRRKQNLSGINVDVDVIAAAAARRPGVAATAGESSDEEEDDDEAAHGPHHPDEEFTYIPGTAVAPLEDEAGVVEDKKGAALSGEEAPVPDAKRSEPDNGKKLVQQQQPLLLPVEIPNDGSFLELMSKQLAEAAASTGANPN